MKTDPSSSIQPFLSIITVTKGNTSELKRTLASVDKQQLLDYEHIVIEGQKPPLPYDISELSNIRRKFVVGLDESLYDAMNIGLTFAFGQYVLYLNAGDELYDDALLNAYRVVSENANVDLFCFNQIFKDHQSGAESVRAHYGPNEPSFRIPFWHQAVLFRAAFHKAFPYDPQYAIAADHDVFLRMLSVSPNVHYSQETISLMYSGGIHQVNRDLADIESLSTLLHNKVIQSRGDLNNCFYFLRLKSSENLRIDHFSISLRIADSIRKLTNQTSAKGLIYGNSLVGRQIFSASPNDFIGFIDRNPEKPCLPSVKVFGLRNLPSNYQFVICSVSLDVKTKAFFANYFKSLGKEFYSLEKFYEL